MKSDRPDPDEFLFPSGYLKALIPGETGSVSKSDAKEKIMHKSRNLDTRFQYLIDDIVFLSQADEIENWEHILLRVTDVDPQTDVGDRDIWDSRLFQSASMDIGTVFAHMARPFVDASDRYDIDELVWGFIIGLVSESIEDFDTEEEQISQIIDSLEEYTTSRREWALTKNERNTDVNLRKEAVQAIENLGVKPTGTLSAAGHSLQTKWWKELELEWQEYGSYEQHKYDVGNFERIWEHVLTDLKAEQPEFANIIALRADLDADIEELDRLAWNKIQPLDVVRVLASEGGKATSRTIADTISYWRDERTPQPPGIGKVGRDLAGSGTSDTNWADRPIVERVSADPQTWQLTRYGELLAFVFHRSDYGYEQLHAYALNRSNCEKEALITDVLTEHYRSSEEK